MKTIFGAGQLLKAVSLWVVLKISVKFEPLHIVHPVLAVEIKNRSFPTTRSNSWVAAKSVPALRRGPLMVGKNRFDTRNVSRQL